MHDMGLCLSLSSCHWQLSFALPKPLYSNWHLISVRPQVVCKVSQGKIRERSFHLMQKDGKYFRRVDLLHPLLLTGPTLDLYTSSFAVLYLLLKWSIKNFLFVLGSEEMRLDELILWLSDSYCSSGWRLLSLSHLMADSACFNVF